MTYQLLDLQLDDLEISYKKDQTALVTFDLDPLVLACVLKRMQGVPFRLSDPELTKFVQPEDYENAEKIRKYYSKKFFWHKLKFDENFTSFKELALMLLTENKLSVQEKHLGVFVRLPWFYDEDIVFDQFKNTLKFNNLYKTWVSDPVSKDLKFLQTTFRWRGKNLFENFWFADKDNYLYNVQLDSRNPLRDIFKQQVTGKTVNFLTKLESRSIEGFTYFRLYSYTIKQD